MLPILADAIVSLQNAVASQSLLFSITVIIVVAAIFAFISKALKQQLILAYIVAGILIGPLVLGLVQSVGLISSLAEIGIAFLLFTAGLEISSSRIKEQTWPSIFAGIFELVIVGIITFFIAVALHLGSIEALYLAIILAFSSTVLVVKILADKKELNTLHSRIAIGILLIQDIAAVLALILLNQTSFFPGIVLAILQAVLLVLIAFFLNKTILNSLFKFASSSYELLFLGALAFVFIFTALAYALNLSIVIGAFIAGIALSNSPYKIEIESKIRPLRDFFTIIFFVSLGMWLTTFNLKNLWIVFIIFLAIILFVKPLVTVIAVRISKYRIKTSLNVGLPLGQLSEFSLVLALMALNAGFIANTIFNMVVLLAIVSMATTPYLMKSENCFYKFCYNFLKIFKETQGKQEFKSCKTEKKTILLFGCHRMGTILLKGLEKHKHKFLVIDFNPDVIKALTKQNISCLYGDALSSELLDSLEVSQAKIAISTIPKKEENIYLTKYLKNKNKNIFVTVVAEKIHDALNLYENGVDFVILPAVISGENALKMIIEMSKKDFKKYKSEQIKYLKELHRYLY